MNHLDDIIANYLSAVENGEQPDRQQILHANPDLEDDLNEFFKNHDEIVGQVKVESESTSQSSAKSSEPRNERSTLGRDNSKTQINGGPEKIGNYTIVEEIDRGGMGIVYRALDQDLQREVAVKMIRAGSSGFRIRHSTI